MEVNVIEKVLAFGDKETGELTSSLFVIVEDLKFWSKPILKVGSYHKCSVFHRCGDSLSTDN